LLAASRVAKYRGYGVAVGNGNSNVGVTNDERPGSGVGGTPPSGVGVGVGAGKAINAEGDLHESKSGPMSNWNAIGLFSVGWLITRSALRLNTRSN
jgi:hypothetical protein